MADKKKVAVLGGGFGALGAAWELSRTDELRARFDVTVYTLGWRLGGKCRSGHVVDKHYRIEEAGPHLWFGFYRSGTELLKDCLAATQRQWDDSFAGFHTFTVMEKVGDFVVPWQLDPQRFAPDGPFDIRHLLRDAIKAVLHAMAHDDDDDGVGDHKSTVLGHLDRIVDRLDKSIAGVEGAAEHVLGWLADLVDVPGLIQKILKLWLDNLDGRLVKQLEQYAEAPTPELWASIQRKTRRRGVGLILSLLVAGIEGVLQALLRPDVEPDNLLQYLDQYDLQRWLSDHGAVEAATDMSSGLLKAIYDVVFAYNGTCGAINPALAAGTGLYGSLVLFGDFPEAFAYDMKGAIGDVLFTPVYQALVARGVKFEFFQEVTALHVDGEGIGSIELCNQVVLKDGPAGYQPFLADPDHPDEPRTWWPSLPLAEQFSPEDQARWEEWNGDGDDFETAQWPYGEPRTLQRGTDFDYVLSGIPKGALASISDELSAASPAWKTAMEKVGTIDTIACQLWFDRTAEKLGLRVESVAMSGFEPRFDTWANKQELLASERWGEGGPVHVEAFCGAHLTPSGAHFHGYGPIYGWFDENQPWIWPAARAADGKGMDYGVLHGSGAGKKRLLEQHLRINHTPTDQYVLSEPGTIQARLEADGSGFDNLFLGGDWVRIDLAVGCMEAATRASRAAARAIIALP